MMTKIVAFTFSMLSLTLLAGCGGAESGNKTGKTSSGKDNDTLTEFQLAHGIGPVTESIEIHTVNPELAQKGEGIFKTNCSACHKMGERYVGPALGDVLVKRSPAFVMNMILNPDGMVKKHPEARKMLAEFMTPMPNQNLNEEEARAIVEYLASVRQQQTK